MEAKIGEKDVIDSMEILRQFGPVYQTAVVWIGGHGHKVSWWDNTDTKDISEQMAERVNQRNLQLDEIMYLIGRNRKDVIKEYKLRGNKGLNEALYTELSNYNVYPEVEKDMLGSVSKMSLNTIIAVSTGKIVLETWYVKEHDKKKLEEVLSKVKDSNWEVIEHENFDI